MADKERTKGTWGVYLKSPAPLVIILNERNGLPQQVIATIRLNNGTEDWNEAQVNAEFICKAVNNYEPMLQALKAFQAIIDLMMDDIKAKGHIAPHHLSDFRVVRQNALDVIKQAETPKN